MHLFLYFRLFKTVDSKQMFHIKVCQWLDSNCGPLVLEATSLPTKPQPLQVQMFDLSNKIISPLMKYKFYNKWMWKNVDPVSACRIQTCNLLIWAYSFNHKTRASFSEYSKHQIFLRLSPIGSVTRCGEILPLLETIWSFWQIFVGSLIFGQILNLLRYILMLLGKFLSFVNRQILNK